MLNLDDDVSLAYYRLQKTFEGDISLPPGSTGTLTGPTEVGTAKAKEDATSPLSEVIRTINDRFGTDFTDEDRLLMEQVVGDLAKDEGLSAQARSNSLDNFRHVFEPKATHAVLERNERNSEIVQQFIANDEIRRLWLDAMIREYHSRARPERSRAARPIRPRLKLRPRTTDVVYRSGRFATGDRRESLGRMAVRRPVMDWR